MTVEWKTGTVYMEYVEDGMHSFTQHRCWNYELFKKARRDEATKKTADGKPTAVRFLDQETYIQRGGR